MLKMKKILVPVDFSKEAGLALEWAVTLAREERGATIYLLNVPLYPPILDAPEAMAGMRAIAESAGAQLADWKKMIPSSVRSKAIVGNGEPADDIVSICASEKIDLVVMTTKGRQGVSRMVAPNLSETVVRRAPCPVMVLHLNARTEALAHAGDRS